jgi:RNA polymerase sigma factor (sigma-70 family)
VATEQFQSPRNINVNIADQANFLSQIECYHRSLMKVCWAYSTNSHDRDDLYQEILGQLWSSFGKYDQTRPFSTWMYRVALNVAIDSRRKRYRRIKTQPLGDLNVPANTTDRAHEECLNELRELLETIGEADRAMIVLFLEGNSYRVIAEILGLSESNVGTRFNRLKKSLRNR